MKSFTFREKGKMKQKGVQDFWLFDQKSQKMSHTMTDCVPKECGYL